MNILDYIPNDAEIGVGLALRLKTAEYLFFLPGKRHMNDTPVEEMFYAGVGGHLEPGESLLECGRREANEEIGMPIEYESSCKTVYIDFHRNSRIIKVDDGIKPLAIFEMIHPPGSPREGGVYHIVIYKALLDRLPQIYKDDEVSGIIIMSAEQVRNGARRASVRQLIQEGARIVGRNVYENTVLYPIGTAEALIYLCDDN
ncbi:hypothetical protein PAESOLCIP111_00299 [Paenibacillus solanacearum]|uniref:Nudix hydrolase domain-containing protein n=1 Tax=Paenibacillus solanacearum TaxID=2048548 RepID=A0A916JUF4_9BACL|nr:NUDIX hydrolase [Paenibacillus solanacearum]CAG7599289.1 hypothetical protein PAESOLCIP111_00299 [Paenibacillus solanacearum]